MSRQITKTVYTFEELSDSAKEKARDWWRTCIDSNDVDVGVEDAVNMAALLGIEVNTRKWTNSYGFSGEEAKVYWSVSGCQGDGACFEGYYSYRKGAPAAIKAETGAGREDASKGDRELLRIAEELQKIQRCNFYALTAKTTPRGNYYWMDVDVSRNDDREMTEDAEETVTELMRDFASWIYHQIEQENDYLNSDEQIDEAITANEYEFDEDGSRI